MLSELENITEIFGDVFITASITLMGIKLLFNVHFNLDLHC